MIVQRLQLGGCRADPLRQRRALDRHALARQDLRLPVERLMVGILRHHDIGDEGLGRQPALDQPRGRRRLDDAGNLVSAVVSQVRQANFGRRVTITAPWPARC